MKSYTITVNGNVYDVTVEENGAVSAPAAAPRRAAAPAAAPAAKPAAAAGAGSVKIEAGAAGKVFKLEKSVGDAVKKGDSIMVLEIMKMETPVVATQDGTVASINVSVGDMVEAGAFVMIIVACFFLYLAIAKGFEPLLLVPIAFGMLLVNIYPDIFADPEQMSNGVGGLFHYFYVLDEWSILPSLIFLGVGAMTDFGPLIANPISFLLGAAAQFGIFGAYFLAIMMGFNDKAAAAVSIIGGADGPTSIFLAGKLGQSGLMGPIAVAAYSYMALVPIIQPPIMKLFTTKKERAIKMENLRPVSKLEKILFPIVVTVVVCTILPTTAPLVGMLMLGNLFRESGVVRQLTDTASNALMYIVVILLGTSVGASTSAEAFLNTTTLKIVALGLIAFMFGTAAGVLFGKLLCFLTKGKINPLIGSAGVSAVPMAARVSQKVGAEEDPTNFLLMHAMGPNVAGVIGTAVAAGVFMAIFGI
ncbi:MAG: sodium ion-translocating decarboxylase subunit beta [Roseburia hominis]|uniref:sodium ion-translocating decarboxylase subunit beta n=2 Tax=Roseburia hominis TaxID=301301 RepID=UPI002910DBF7|nr:sodium ion-translocating decarboxylase subunit beta [Roseburia hominis]MDU6922358.1 sodium ion-translocating decarboxylase subunit beta [Roseburia hominis]